MSRIDQVEAFLAMYPQNVQDTAFAARKLLRDALPGVDETVDESAKLLGYRYGPGYKGVVCTLILSRTEVKLGIFRGAELSDPKHLMTGSGKIHRHVPLSNPADLRRPGLKPLLRQALTAWRKRSRASA